ncbi:MAG: hypothetical protein NT085_03480 [candidate division SR1 bacterium]|nr:hypothetical protein [candidate division SR1 bacterium]
MYIGGTKKLTYMYLTLGVVLTLGLLYFGTSFAINSSTNTTLGITVGTFSFFKDTGSAMDSYFLHPGNQSNNIDIGSYAASLEEISASSASDHRFTVSDMLGSAFTITLQSSSLTASGVTDIPATAITYTGTDRLGTGKALTATGAPNTSLNTPVTFVSRNNSSGLSKYSQEITLKVQIPAAQAPASYTGQLIFTY